MRDRAMMRTIGIAAIMVLAGSTAPCQNTFITQLDSVQAGFAGSGRSIVETDSGYICFGHHRSQDGTGRTRCAVYKLGFNGDYLSRYEIGTGESYDMNYGFFDPITSLRYGGYAAPILRFNGFDHHVALARFDGQGQLLDTHPSLEVDPLDSMLLGTRQLRETQDGGFALCGFKSFNDSSTFAYLAKLDSVGSIVWEHVYGANDQLFEAISIAQYTDGGYVIAGYRLPGNLVNLGWLIRTDSAGNELWRRFFGKHDGGWGAVRVAADGGIVTYSGFADDGWPFGWGQQMLTKWSASGSIIWQKRSHYFYGVSPTDFEILPDQSMITCSTWSWFAQLAKYSAEGDSLWSRHLAVFDNTGNNQPYDVEPTSDGGFVLTGEVLQTLGDPTPGLSTIFVIKTDSLGCVVPGCQNTGVQEYVMDLQAHLRISPNPASDVVSLSLELPQGGEVQGQVRAVLLDAAGRLVLEHPVRQNLNQLRATLDVSGLPAGTYYLHVRDAKRWLAGSKVIVE